MITGRLKSIFNSETGRNFIIYSFGAIFLKGISFLLIPLYTRILPPAVYGNLDLLNTWSGILDVIFSLGLVQVIFMEFVHHDQASRLNLLNRILSVYLCFSTVLYAVMFVVAAGSFLDALKDVNTLMIALSMASTYLLFFQSILLTVLRLAGKAMRATVLQVILGCVNIGMNLWLVYYLRLGMTGILISGFSVTALSVIYAFYLYRQYGFTFRIDLQKVAILKFLKTGLPFVPGALAVWMMYSANRWILLNYTDLNEVGIFSVASRFGAVFDQLMIQPFLSAYVPVVLNRIRSDNHTSPILKVAVLSLILFTVLGLAMAMFGKWFIGPTYHSALPIIPVLAIGSAFSLIAQAAAVPLVYHKKSMLMLYAVLLGSVGSILGNFLFVDKFGSMGAAFGTLAGNMVWAFMIILFTLVVRRSRNTDAGDYQSANVN